MKPITFHCRQPIAKPAAEICEEIADLARWPGFTGYGLLPGITSAVYETRTAGMVGSRIQVRNTDGSSHVEEILAWEPGTSVVMKLQQFTPPLKSLATHFVESWSFAAAGETTMVTRSFQMFPTGALARPFLWLISLLFRRAIARHLLLLAREAAGG